MICKNFREEKNESIKTVCSLDVDHNAKLLFLGQFPSSSKKKQHEGEVQCETIHPNKII